MTIFSKIDQIGIVVRNISDRIKELEGIGLGPFSTLELNDLDIIYRGIKHRINMKIALTHIGGIQLELIEAEGRCFYTDFLEKCGGGLNHIGIFVSDIDSELRKYVDMGFNILQEGSIMGVKWIYLDTSGSLGFVLELIEVP